MAITCTLQRKKRRWFLFAAAAAGLLVASPKDANATPREDYEKGCQAYQLKQYDIAATYLVAASSMQPTHWPSLYQLGNALVQMKQYAEARDAYARCAALKPPAAIAGHCKIAVDRLTVLEAQDPAPEVLSQTAPPGQLQVPPGRSRQSAHPARVSQAGSADKSQKIAAAPPAKRADDRQSTGDKIAAAEAEKAATPESALMKQARAYQERLEKEAEEQRKRILEHAEAEAQRITEEGAQRLKAAKESSSQWYIYSDGTLGVDIHHDDEKALQDEIQQRIHKVRSEADRKVAEIKVPSIDQLASDLEGHMTTTTTRSGGVRLNRIGTNLHVRNYR